MIMQLYDGLHVQYAFILDCCNHDQSWRIQPFARTRIGWRQTFVPDYRVDPRKADQPRSGRLRAFYRNHYSVRTYGIDFN